MFRDFSHRRFDHNGVMIDYVIAGQGPALLMLHGFPQNKAMWARVAPQLISDYTVICADLRGYGDSSCPPDTADHSAYSFRTMAKDQVALMQHLGFEAFHVIGHDRGARVAHRMALDHPKMVESMTVMDIVPTLHLLQEADKEFANTYWHWFFLAQPSPFPEQIIAKDPDCFFGACLFGWGGAQRDQFDTQAMAAYHQTWSRPQNIAGMCNDYRAALTIDLAHDMADGDVKVQCPTLVLYGENGAMAGLYDIPATWRDKCSDLCSEAIPGGHFFVDQYPEKVLDSLEDFLRSLD